jgi:hypothetical protein
MNLLSTIIQVQMKKDPAIAGSSAEQLTI